MKLSHSRKGYQGGPVTYTVPRSKPLSHYITRTTKENGKQYGYVKLGVVIVPGSVAWRARRDHASRFVSEDAARSAAFNGCLPGDVFKIETVARPRPLTVNRKGK